MHEINVASINRSNINVFFDLCFSVIRLSANFSLNFEVPGLFLNFKYI